MNLRRGERRLYRIFAVRSRWRLVAVNIAALLLVPCGCVKLQTLRCSCVEIRSLNLGGDTCWAVKEYSVSRSFGMNFFAHFTTLYHVTSFVLAATVLYKSVLPRYRVRVSSWLIILPTGIFIFSSETPCDFGMTVSPSTILWTLWLDFIRHCIRHRMTSGLK